MGGRWTDAWVKASDKWVRRHNRARMCLFTPMKVVGGPVDSKECGTIRTTKGTFVETGEDFVIVDNWKDRDVAHRALDKYWVGTTVFRKGKSG